MKVVIFGAVIALAACTSSEEPNALPTPTVSVSIDPNYKAKGPIRPVTSLTANEVCLGDPGGPPPPTPRPQTHCYLVAQKVHTGRGVQRGAYVEVRLNKQGRVNWIELYRGPKPA